MSQPRTTHWLSRIGVPVALALLAVTCYWAVDSDRVGLWLACLLGVAALAAFDFWNYRGSVAGPSREIGATPAAVARIGRVALVVTLTVVVAACVIAVQDANLASVLVVLGLALASGIVAARAFAATRAWERLYGLISADEELLASAHCRVIRGDLRLPRSLILGVTDSRLIAVPTSLRARGPVWTALVTDETSLSSDEAMELTISEGAKRATLGALPSQVHAVLEAVSVQRRSVQRPQTG